MNLVRSELTRQRVRNAGVRIDGLDSASHHLVDVMTLERIDAVFAVDVIAAPRDLLGEDRAPHDEHREAIRNGGGGQAAAAAHWHRA